MSVWLRYAAWLALILAAPVAAHAQSAAQRAAQLNDEGKDLWLKKNDLDRAVVKFRQAIQLDPQARYYFNLCYALHQVGHFREALPECEATQQAAGADDKLRKKAQVVIDDINTRLPPDVGPDPADPGTEPPQGTEDPDGSVTSDPPYGDPGTTQGATSAGTPGPIPGLYQPAEIPDDYKWSAGADVGFLATGLGGESFGGSGVMLKLFANFIWLPEQQIGAQGYINFGQVTGNGDFGEPLNFVDLGVALYKHIPMARFHLTPLIGVQATGLQSELFFYDDALTTFGVRAEASFSWMFGPERQHVISATPGLSLYLPVSKGYIDAVDYDLDKGSGALSLMVGYSLRFTTPFGQTSLITLE